MYTLYAINLFKKKFPGGKYRPSDWVASLRSALGQNVSLQYVKN